MHLILRAFSFRAAAVWLVASASHHFRPENLFEHGVSSLRMAGRRAVTFVCDDILCTAVDMSDVRIFVCVRECLCWCS